jgi:hypothetical protein
MSRLRAILNSKGQPLAFTTECFTECGIDVFDSYLPDLHHPRPEEGCLYDAVYHEYTSFHGCYAGWEYKPDGLLPKLAAICFALGRPIGWFYHGFHNDRLMAPDARTEMSFVAQLCKARIALKQFLAFGAMLPPPAVTILNPDPNASESPVISSAWRSRKQVLVIAVNYSDKPAVFRLNVSRLGGHLVSKPVWCAGDAGACNPNGSVRIGARGVIAWSGEGK